MRTSFLDDPNFFRNMSIFLVAIPVLGVIFAACSQPNTPEEKATSDVGYGSQVKEDLVVISPRPGVECYILRGYGSGTPRVMSCVGTVPTTMGQ
jgi:hypothetical protein